MKIRNSKFVWITTNMAGISCYWYLCAFSFAQHWTQHFLLNNNKHFLTETTDQKHSPSKLFETQLFNDQSSKKQRTTIIRQSNPILPHKAHTNSDNYPASGTNVDAMDALRLYNAQVGAQCKHMVHRPPSQHLHYIALRGAALEKMTANVCIPCSR